MSWVKFNEDLERGREFEDYASERLWGLGLAVMMYGSRRYQDKGESLNGVEIKYEGVFRRTGRLYIECCQRKVSGWELSGAFRRDNTWLWVIGDYEGFYLFTKVDLQMMHGLEDGVLDTGIFDVASTSNTKGYFLPVGVADYMCVDYVNHWSDSLGQYGVERDFGLTMRVRGDLSRGMNPLLGLGDKLVHRSTG